MKIHLTPAPSPPQSYDGVKTRRGEESCLPVGRLDSKSPASSLATLRIAGHGAGRAGKFGMTEKGERVFVIQFNLTLSSSLDGLPSTKFPPTKFGTGGTGSL